jgi:hypothetical protein
MATVEQKSSSNTSQVGVESACVDTEVCALISVDPVLFGPITEEIYRKYAPRHQENYAIEMITTAFSETADEAARQDRRLLWRHYENLIEHLQYASQSADVVRESYFFVESINPLARAQSEVRAPTLLNHLSEVTAVATCLLLDEQGNSRFPMLISDRVARLTASVVAPLHDLAKFLGSMKSQVIPDHEVLMAEVVQSTFIDKTIVDKFGIIRLSTEDVEFVSSLIGDHENIFKEDTRSMFIHGTVEIDRAKALFSLIDTLGAAIQQRGSGWVLEPSALEERFGDLCFRHLDLVNGKIFRPKWIEFASSDMITTLARLEECGLRRDSDDADARFQDQIIATAEGAVTRALREDVLRNTRKKAPLFSPAQLEQVARLSRSLEVNRADDN